MGFKVLIFAFLHGILSITFGGPELSSSTSKLELSGEVCPDYITLTCSKNTTERIFVWYTNDIELARFDEEDVTPFTITTRPDLFNATVRVTSVVEVNGYFSFDNFTLTARVSDFLPLQGQNLTCGTLLDRSEPFGVYNFSLYKRSLLTNVTVIPQYDEDFYLNALMVSLNLLDSECSNINYFYELVLYRDTTTRMSSETIECSEGRICTTIVIVSRNGASNHIVITRRDISGGSSYISDSFEGVIGDPSERPALQVVYFDCNLRCESNIRGDCELHYRTSSSSVVSETSRTSINNTILFQPQLEANIVYSYNVTFFVDGKTFITQGNFTVEGICTQSASRMGLIIGVATAAVVAAILGLAVALALAMFCLCSKSNITHSHIKGEQQTEAHHIVQLHGVDNIEVKYDCKGISNAEQSVVQGHKKSGQKGTDAILYEKEAITKATLKLQMQQEIETEQIRSKKNNANKIKPNVPSPGERYGGRHSHLYSVHPTSDKYSSLQCYTRGDDKQSPSPANIPGDDSNEMMDLTAITPD